MDAETLAQLSYLQHEAAHWKELAHRLAQENGYLREEINDVCVVLRQIKTAMATLSQWPEKESRLKLILSTHERKISNPDW